MMVEMTMAWGNTAAVFCLYSLNKKYKLVLDSVLVIGDVLRSGLPYYLSCVQV